MCTVVFGWHVFPDAPIVVAANRDERFDREAVPPSRWTTDPAVLAPRDEEAGGTWMGVNEHRVFVGLTNRWVDADLSGTRSRGLFVADVLGAKDVTEGVATVKNSVRSDSYEGFNLLIADTDQAFLLEYDGDLSTRKLAEGVHVVANTGADGEYEIPSFRENIARSQGENVDAVREMLEPHAGESPTDWLQRGKRVLGDHDNGVCIHGEGYGTVSTSLISVRRRGPVEYYYAEGPPCTTEARPVDNQV